ncbi:unnamed protein product [Didymodactylos carnosus]|uniref:RLR CTR domain-containing protein n=1 Tax=Didymodactylos carnosus TaxID=1234261 RepID=A0A815TU32_9BILA|nr:unnamed protein product [Didymodactylos carnosus]CAF4368638.1 unnamed protein product [Didymodactylos carnosus]
MCKQEDEPGCLNSAYYLITTSDSQNYMRERINRLKEKQMDEALEQWKQMSPYELKQNIAKIQVNKKKFIKKEIVNGWQREEEQTNAASSMRTDTPLVGKVSCRSCGYYLGKLEWLRRRNTCYFVQKQHVLERVEIELKLEPKQIQNIQINGKVRCGNTQCREELGGAQEFLNRKDMKEICALKCNQLKFSYINEESGRENIIVGKKWTELPFRIAELETRPPRRS